MIWYFFLLYKTGLCIFDFFQYFHPMVPPPTSPYPGLVGGRDEGYLELGSNPRLVGLRKLDDWYRDYGQ